METYSIAPNKKISINVPRGFYSAQSMISLKAVGIGIEGEGRVFSFGVSYKNSDGYSVGFHLSLNSPYFFAGGTFNYQANQNAYPGPFFTVEIESSPTNPPMVLQVGFTNRLA